VNVVKQCLIADNGTVTDTDFQTIGDMQSSTVASNGTLMVGTTATALSKRDTDDADFSHTWAMVCGSDSNRYSTAYCYQAPHSFYCSSRGKLSTKGAGNKYCETICRCVNLITGTCVYGWAAAAVCRVGSDGTIFDSDLQIMGNTANASQLSNGTWLLPSASKRGIDIMTISQDSVSDAETLPDTTVDSSQALAPRDVSVPQKLPHQTMFCFQQHRF
jgi:hypothetical protein